MIPEAAPPPNAPGIMPAVARRCPAPDRFELHTRQLARPSHASATRWTMRQKVYGRVWLAEYRRKIDSMSDNHPVAAQAAHAVTNAMSQENGFSVEYRCCRKQCGIKQDRRHRRTLQEAERASTITDRLQPCKLPVISQPNNFSNCFGDLESQDQSDNNRTRDIIFR